MRTKTLLLFVGGLMLLASCGVHTDRFRTRQELISDDSTEHIVSLVMTDGNKIEFADPGGIYSPFNRQITGQSEKGKPEIVPIAMLQSCEVSHVNFWWTFLAYWFGGALLLAAIILLSPGAYKGGP